MSFAAQAKTRVESATGPGSSKERSAQILTAVISRRSFFTEAISRRSGCKKSKFTRCGLWSRRKDYEKALHFYRDVLGLKEQAAFVSEGGHVTILEAGAATLELTDSRHAEFIDEVEVGRRCGGAYSGCVQGGRFSCGDSGPQGSRRNGAC